MKNRIKGFTLIELLIVISIIGVLAGLGMAGAAGVKMAARKQKAATTIASLQTALDSYKNHMGIYPPDDSSKMVMNHLTGFVDNDDATAEQFQNDPDWQGPYYQSKKSEFRGGLINEALIDPWNKPYVFHLSPEKIKHNKFSVDIYSCGPNRIDDGGKKDDIGNW